MEENLPVADVSNHDDAQRDAFAKRNPYRAQMAKGQGSTSVFWREPASEPHNYAELLKSGKLLAHPSGRFVRP